MKEKELLKLMGLTLIQCFIKTQIRFLGVVFFLNYYLS